MKKRSINDIIHGASGITKAKLGIDKCDLWERRLKVCYNCPRVEINKKGTPFCAECGCNLNFKTKLNREECPLGKW